MRRSSRSRFRWLALGQQFRGTKEAHMRRWSVAGLLALMVAGGMLAAGEPKPLTEEQKARLKERDQYQAEAKRQATAGKLPEVTGAVEKKLAIEREVFGNRHEDVAGSLEMLARLHELREDWAAVRKALQ